MVRLLRRPLPPKVNNKDGSGQRFSSSIRPRASKFVHTEPYLEPSRVLHDRRKIQTENEKDHSEVVSDNLAMQIVTEDAEDHVKKLEESHSGRNLETHGWIPIEACSTQRQSKYANQNTCSVQANAITIYTNTAESQKSFNEYRKATQRWTSARCVPHPSPISDLPVITISTDDISSLALQKTHYEKTKSILANTFLNNKAPVHVIQMKAHLGLPMRRYPSHIVRLLVDALHERKTYLERILEEEHSIVQNVPEGTFLFHKGPKHEMSPFGVQTYGGLLPSELAILECILSNGKNLNLRALFLSNDQLPEFRFLTRTLTQLDLSYNMLTHIPEELFAAINVEVLKIRGNPIKEVSHDIFDLKRLKVLIMSYCKITKLPVELFQLRRLMYVDVSYNELTQITPEVGYLESITHFNLEGNDLTAIPCQMIWLRRLRFLNITQNDIQPGRNWRREPKHIASLKVLAAVQYEHFVLPTNVDPLPEVVQELLQKAKVCHNCGRSRFDEASYEVCCTMERVIGIKQLPVIVSCCSSHCADQAPKNDKIISHIMREKQALTRGLNVLLKSEVDIHTLRMKGKLF